MVGGSGESGESGIITSLSGGRQRLLDSVEARREVVSVDSTACRWAARVKWTAEARVSGGVASGKAYVIITDGAWR